MAGDAAAYWNNQAMFSAVARPTTLWSLAILIPSLSVGVRRLHDTNRSGWWLLIGVIPLVGWVILIVWLAAASDPAGARYDRVQPRRAQTPDDLRRLVAAPSR